jgi:hypothetical protein
MIEQPIRAPAQQPSAAETDPASFTHHEIVARLNSGFAR